MTTVILEAVEAEELAELLEFFKEGLDTLPGHQLTELLFGNCEPYGTDDLRADLTRLIERLRTSPLTP